MARKREPKKNPKKPGWTGSRRRAETKGQVSEVERKLCQLIAQHVKIADAAREVGITTIKAYRTLDRPAVKAYSSKLISKVQEKAIEKTAEKISDRMANLLEIADDRLLELLTAKRGVITEENTDASGPLPVDDSILTRAIDLAYKRKAAYPASSSGMASVLNQNNTVINVTNNPNVPSSGAGVYEPKWVRQRYGIVDPESERIEREYAVEQYLPANTVGGGAESLEKEMETAD